MTWTSTIPLEYVTLTCWVPTVNVSIEQCTAYVCTSYWVRHCMCMCTIAVNCTDKLIMWRSLSGLLPMPLLVFFLSSHIKHCTVLEWIIAVFLIHFTVRDDPVLEWVHLLRSCLTFKAIFFSLKDYSQDHCICTTELQVNQSRHAQSCKIISLRVYVVVFSVVV